MCLCMPTKIMRIQNIKEDSYDFAHISREWGASLDLYLNSTKQICFLDVYNTYKVYKTKVKGEITTKAEECINILRKSMIQLLEDRRYSDFLSNIIEKICKKYDPFTINNDFENFNIFHNYKSNSISQKIDILFLIFETKIKIEYNENFSKEGLFIYISIIERFMDIIEIKDTYTRKHSERVYVIAKKFGRYISLPEFELDELSIASILHDIGKLGIPESILVKEGRLTETEYDVVKKHAEYGELIVKNLPGFNQISNVIKYHHERYDGMGYYSLNSQSISRNMYIIALCDTFDSMNSDRPYRKALSFNTIIDEYKRCAGRQFEPNLCNEFIGFLFNNICDIQRMYA